MASPGRPLQARQDLHAVVECSNRVSLSVGVGLGLLIRSIEVVFPNSLSEWETAFSKL